jgi:TetR/AcrR family transcriptional regulator, cholesterol catabolism regulator
MATDARRRSARTNDEMSAQTQEMLLAAAVKLFAANGYEQTSLHEIAHEAGLTKGALYYHFKSKEDVLRRVHDDMIERIIAESRSVLDAGLSPADTLRELIHVHMSAIETRGDAIRVFLRERRGLSAANWRDIKQRRGEIEPMFVDVIAAGQRAGQFGLTADSRLLAFGVLGMICWATEWFRPNRRPAVEIAEMFADMALSGLSIGGQPAAPAGSGASRNARSSFSTRPTI